STLVFPDELVEPASLDGFDVLDDVSVSDKELVMARSLVEAMSDDFVGDRYQDEYRLAVEQIIEQKAAGKPIVVADEPAPDRSNVIDLAAARGPYIDQSQSLNLFMESPNIGRLSSMYM
ncbi:MAG TPA: hypothetical protein PLV68_07365, partial [Ilumatobacteraceae bacterium]|nr:hypothetical protein [Ilumatobacteraceae bacterium]